jgi:chromosome segregation ATPase
MDNKMMVLLEDIKSLVLANVEGQKAFEERFERRLTNLELDMAEIKKTILVVIKEIGNVKTELADVKADLADVRNDLADVRNDLADVKTELVDVRNDLADVKTELADAKNELKILESKVAQLRETVTASNRKNEMWFDLLAREYGKLRLEMEALKEEVNLLSQNVPAPAE